jgi:hypothetical protein
VSAVFLAGCGASDEAVLDLSGSVFFVFVMLVVAKYATPKIVRTTLFARTKLFIQRNCDLIIRTLYAIAALLIVVGIWPGASTLSHIHVLTGLAFAVIASHIRPLVWSESGDVRKRSFEIIALGIVVIAVLISLWYFGLDLFKALR